MRISDWSSDVCSSDLPTPNTNIQNAMKLTIERGALLKALAYVQSVVERRNTIPILSNVLVDASGATLSLTANDMDLTIVETIPAEVAAPGATTAQIGSAHACTPVTNAHLVYRVLH